MSGNLLSVLADFLKDRKQRVVLNGLNTKWANIEIRVPQGPISDLLTFFIQIKNLSDYIR